MLNNILIIKKISIALRVMIWTLSCTTVTITPADDLAFKNFLIVVARISASVLDLANFSMNTKAQ